MRRFTHRHWKRELLRSLVSWATGDLESLLDSIVWLKAGWAPARRSLPLVAFLLRQLVQRNPGLMELRVSLAQNLLLQGRYEEVIAVCDDALAGLASMDWSGAPSAVQWEKRFLRGPYRSRNLETAEKSRRSPEEWSGRFWGLKGRAELFRGNVDAAMEGWERDLRSVDASTRPMVVSVCRLALKLARRSGDQKVAEEAERRLEEILAALSREP